MQSGSMTLCSTRTEIFKGAYTLLINADGSINVNATISGTIPVTGTVAISQAVPGMSNGVYVTNTSLTIAGTVAVSNFPATQVISGTVAVSNFPATQAVTGPLTDTQLRATPVPISGTVTANTGLTQPLTDAQLRATAVSVSVSNFPSNQNVTLAAETTKVIGTVNISSGQSISVSNFPATQPVSGTVSISGSVAVTGAFFQSTQPVSVASLPLPAGASTETTLAAMSAKLPATLGQAAMAASMSVALASDQTPITDGTASGILNNNTTDTVEISCDGRASASLQLTGTWTGTVAFECTIDNWTTIQTISGVQNGSVAFQLNSTVNGFWSFNVSDKQKIRARKTSAGTGTVSVVLRTGNAVPWVTVFTGSAANLPVTATQSGTWTTKDAVATSATLSNVASSASSVNLLASNANRRNAIIYNDSTAILYVKFGTTASNSSYTVQVPSQGTYTLPVPCYTGAIDGIWASANGNARITELV